MIILMKNNNIKPTMKTYSQLITIDSLVFDETEVAYTRNGVMP